MQVAIVDGGVLVAIVDGGGGGLVANVDGGWSRMLTGVLVAIDDGGGGGGCWSRLLIPIHYHNAAGS